FVRVTHVRDIVHVVDGARDVEGVLHGSAIVGARLLSSARAPPARSRLVAPAHSTRLGGAVSGREDRSSAPSGPLVHGLDTHAWVRLDPRPLARPAPRTTGTASAQTTRGPRGDVAGAPVGASHV